MSLDGSPPEVTQSGFLVILSCDSNYSPDSSSSSDVSPSVLLPPSSSRLESSASPAEPLPAVAVVSVVVVPPVLYNGAKQSLISCSVGLESLPPSSALDISSSEASPPNIHSMNCWKFSPSSAVPVSVGESISGLSGLDGVSNVDWA